jgi:hypothetical protein
MKRPLRDLCNLSTLLLCTVLLNACISAPTAKTLYTLQPVKQELLGRDFAGWGEMILLMPVRLAPQLQNRGLISQRSPTESMASIDHLWAGPLDQQIAVSLIGNLKELLGTDNLAIYPGPRFGATRYQVEVEISEFSGSEQSFTLRAVYTLSDSTSKTMLQRKSFLRTLAIDKPDHSGYVASASRAIGDLSKEMAIALLAARQSQPQPPRSHEK